MRDSYEKTIVSMATTYLGYTESSGIRYLQNVHNFRYVDEIYR